MRLGKEIEFSTQKMLSSTARQTISPLHQQSKNECVVTSDPVSPKAIPHPWAQSVSTQLLYHAPLHGLHPSTAPDPALSPRPSQRAVGLRFSRSPTLCLLQLALSSAAPHPAARVPPAPRLRAPPASPNPQGSCPLPAHKPSCMQGSPGRALPPQVPTRNGTSFLSCILQVNHVLGR